MENETAGDEIIKQGSAGSDKIPVPPDNPTPEHAKSIGENHQQDQIADLKDRIRRAERWMISLTFAIAFFALCSIIVGILQWRAMRGQLNEMKTGSADTHALADAAKSQADATKKQLEAFEVVEGANIGVGLPGVNLVAGIIQMPFENYGRIPSPRTFIYVGVYKFLEKQPPFYAKHYVFGGDRTGIPTGTGKYGVNIPLELQPGETEKIVTGKERLQIGITLRYDNGFGKTSQPGFCFSYAPTNPTGWDACPVATFEDLQKMTPQK